MKKYAFTVVSLFLFFVLGGGASGRRESRNGMKPLARRPSTQARPSGNPLFESRVYAMTQAAVDDALNAIDRRYRPYALDLHLPTTPGSSPEAAEATAHTTYWSISSITSWLSIRFPSRSPR